MAMRKKYLLPAIIFLLLVIAGAGNPGQVLTGNSAGEINSGDTAWMIVASALVLIMTPALGFFYGGMANRKNIISTVFQSVISLGLMSVVWVAFGFSLCFGDDIGGIIGNPFTFKMFQGVGLKPNETFSATIPFVMFAMFQLKFAIITPALITGSFAQRVKFSGYLIFTTLFFIFIYAPVCHMTWHPDGILFKYGILDFAGGTVVHMTAGFAALAGAMFLGPRTESERTHEFANVPYVIIGTGLLWFGWFGFNAGSALGVNAKAANAFATTNTAAAAAMIAWVLVDAMRGNKISSIGACVGAVVGLVAITPACGFVNVGESIAIGAIAAVASNFAVHFKNKSTIDDTLDVFPCHGVGGMVGMIMTGIFAADYGTGITDWGLAYGETKTFIHHMIGLVGVAAFAFLGSYALYFITNLIDPIRVTKEEEELGLDITQHGESYASLRIDL
ncbi:MAG TPA: ammonium transporter [Chitinophagales bacterium]|jgi:Amt family ammonium transporter|nr:ammonium transporter [Chitinophagales bacterium]